MKMQDLTGKVAVITGASSGIGEANLMDAIGAIAGRLRN